MLWVTLYCDASYSGEHGGAWSIWLKSSEGRIIKSGKCPSDVRDAQAAEFYAAEMGVQIARREWSADGIQINTDCMAVVHGLGSGYRWSTRKDIRRAQDRIFKLGGRLRLKHVKAHTSGQDTRSYLNRQVDRYANKARKGGHVAQHYPKVEPKLLIDDPIPTSEPPPHAPGWDEEGYLVR